MLLFWLASGVLAQPATGGGATANGTTLSYSFSLVAGTATGEASATGQTVSYTYSLVPGAASAGSGGTANGVTVSYSFALVAGGANGAASANGVTVSYTYSLLAGSASGGGGSTANGVTLEVFYSLIPGAASSDNVSTFGGGGGRSRPWWRSYKAVRFTKEKRDELVEEVLDVLQPEAGETVTQTEVAAAMPAISAFDMLLTEDAEFRASVLRDVTAKVNQAIQRELEDEEDALLLLM